MLPIHASIIATQLWDKVRVAALTRVDNVDPRELETYFHQHIPTSAAMQVSVVEISSEEVVLGAPLAPNINHRETAFGGSVSALAILAAWALLHTRLAAMEFKCTLVIQSNTMQYEKPIAGNFIATASIPTAERWLSFIRMLQRKGRGPEPGHSAAE